MKQIFIFHGGSSFDSYEHYLADLRNLPVEYERLKPTRSWKDWLGESLPEDYDLLLPSLPNRDNAVYDEWKTYFEKLIPFFTRDTQLIGYSLGGMLLAKYLHENKLPIPARRIILLAPGYNDDSNEELGSFGVQSAVGMKYSCDEIHLLHSTDDPIVPFTELAKFRQDLPDATVHEFTDRSHFFIDEFPELLEILTQK